MNPCGFCDGDVVNLHQGARVAVSIWMAWSGIDRPVKAGRCTRCRLGFVLDATSTEESTTIYGLILADGGLVGGDILERADAALEAGALDGFSEDEDSCWLEAVVREVGDQMLVKIPAPS